MKKNNLVILVLIILVLGLIAWSRFSSPAYEQIKGWKAAGVNCLPSGHQNLGQHIHPDLYITVDGDVVSIPANVGINTQCMAELHTHDTTGKIHIETVSPTKEMTIKQFFEVWGEPIEKEGYALQVAIGSTTMDYDTNVQSIEEYIFKDLEQIQFTYLSNEALTSNPQ